MSALPEPSEPAILQRVRYMYDPLGYIARCQRQLGDVFLLRLFGRGMVLVCSPELVKEVFHTPDDVLAAGAAKVALVGRVLGQGSTLLLDGDAHVERRRLMLPRFRGEAIEAFGPVVLEACQRMLASISDGTTFSLHPVLHKLAFDVIARALFAETPRPHLEPLLGAMREYANDVASSRLLMFPRLQLDLGPFSPWGHVLRVVERTRSALLGEIRRRRCAETDRADLAGLLLGARHEDGSSLSELEIRDELLTMIVAGHETTAIALAWLCYAVFTRPAVQERVLDELGTCSSPATPSEIARLPYLDAVVRESLRYYSLLANASTRLVQKPCRLGSYEVPPGAMLGIAYHALHRRAGVFERPDEFWPDRFLATKYSPYEWIPFGGGAHRCLGMAFALFEIKLVLATLLAQRRWQVMQPRVRPVRHGAFLTPSRGLLVRASVRSGPYSV